MCSRNGITLSIIVGALLLTLSPLSQARPSINLGLSYGVGKISVDGDSFNDGSLGNTVQIDPDTTAWNIYLELNFNRYLRMEINHDESGTARMKGFSDGSGTYWRYGPVSADYSVASIKVGAVGLLPLGANDRFKLLGKLGLSRWLFSGDLKSVNFTGTEFSTDVSPYYGVGVELDLTNLVSLRVQHEIFSVSTKSDYLSNDYHFDYTSTTMGFLFRF